MRPIAPTLTLAVFLLSGCIGGDGPAYDASRYQGGDCATPSRAVFEIDAAVEPVVDDGAKPASAVKELTRHQAALIAAVPAIGDAQIRDLAQKVVDAVGFYRIGLDAKNYTPELAKAVAARSDEFLSRCSVS